MKKNFLFVCIALLVAMSLIVSCDNSSKTPSESQTVPTKEFTVTFDPNFEGGGAEPKAVKVEDGKLVAEPEKPTREGYSFVEWQLDGQKFDFKTPIKKDITLKAKWNPLFKVNETLLNDTINTIEGTTKAYNVLTASTTFKASKVTITGFKYYVCIGDNSLGTINKIKIGNSTFTKDQEVAISMGNNAFIKDKVFYEDENNKLYIAAPILAVELTEKNSFMINNISYDLGVEDPPISEPTSISVKWKNGSTNTVTELEDGSYLSTIKEAMNNWLEFEFASESPISFFLTKKTKIKKTGEKEITYGYTGADSSSYDSSKKVLAFYPQPYGSEGITYKTIEYSIYFNDKAKHIKLDFKTE